MNQTRPTSRPRPPRVRRRKVRRIARDAALVAAGAALGAGLLGAAGSAATEAEPEEPADTASSPRGTEARASTPDRRLGDRLIALDIGAALDDAPAPRTVWDDLADCESGDWIDGRPQQATARWDYGTDFDHGDFYEGGLNFHPRTWDAFRDADMADHAGNATRREQITVAERVLEAQGWGAWPVCSRKVGLR